jgi:hypothetical protein
MVLRVVLVAVRLEKLLVQAGLEIHLLPLHHKAMLVALGLMEEHRLPVLVVGVVRLPLVQTVRLPQVVMEVTEPHLLSQVRPFLTLAAEAVELNHPVLLAQVAQVVVETE